MRTEKFNEHYKMYKAGKQWLFAAIASFALVGGVSLAGNNLHVNFLPHTTMMASADDASLSFDGVTFDTPEEALVGRSTDLAPVTGQAATGKQSISYQAKNVYVRRDAKTHQFVANYIAGKTVITLTSVGARDTMSLQTSSDGGKNWTTVKEVQAAEKDGSVDFDVPASIDTNNAMIRVTYISDSSQGDGSDGKEHDYTPENVAIITADAQAAQQKTDQAQADASLAQKKTTQANFDAEYAKVQGEINGDTGLTTSQKNAQLTAAKTAYDNASASYKTFDNAADTQNAETTGKQNIDNAYQKAAETLDQQREDAKAVVKSRADQANSDIENNPNMTDAEKTAAKQQVKDAQDALDGNIDNATADNIISVRDESTNNGKITGANNNYNEKLSDRITDAVNKIEQDRKDAYAKVDKDPTLTSDEKSKQEAAIDQAAQDATAKVKADTTAQTVVDDLSNADTNIPAPYKTGTPIPTQRDNANQDFKKIADQTINDINNDSSLTDDEKQQQRQAVAAALTKAQQAINDSNTADDINKVRNNVDYSNAIKNAHQAGAETLDDRKKNAQDAINKARQETEDKIKNDSKLSTKQKNDQKAAAEDAWNTANNAINASGADAQAIKDASDTGVTNIDNAY
ncbi:DUF1542 domain-containing protein [Fructobacillus sp. M158]|uniref:DUF1542 domain-containing protein n=1 Tax=Fructobacillus parabroussonetiae TaxID=2713174 RepID=UPI00200B175A|nr:DUF1542 domain-containing protein [Fructobacillus parabroussonetiae]MCK8617182.1 DUF1542 domain-containing protein [Fructobacillus parabroussonetiae]